MTAPARRDFAGGAVPTTITGSLLSTTLTIPIADATGWPSGTNGKFYVAIDYEDGNTKQEKVLVTSRSGLSLTVASTADRGADGTSAQTHSSGARIIHCGTAADLEEANAHHADVTRDDHTQYARKSQNLADLTNAGTARTNLGLGTVATQAAAGVAITGGTISGITDLAVADGGTGASTAAGARSNLGVVPGVDVQAFDADLLAIAALVSAANKMPYATGAGTWSLADLTAFARTLLDDADAAAARTTLGLGTLATLSAIASAQITDGSIATADLADGLITGPKMAADDFIKIDQATQVAEPVTISASGAPAATPTTISSTTVTMDCTRAGQKFLVLWGTDVTYTGSGTPGLAVFGVSVDDSNTLSTYPQAIGYINIASTTARVTLSPKPALISGLSVASHTFRLKGYKENASDTVQTHAGQTGLVVVRIG